MKRSNEVQKCIVKTVLRIVKVKGAAKHFKDQLSFLHDCGVDVGSIGHSRYV